MQFWSTNLYVQRNFSGDVLTVLVGRSAPGEEYTTVISIILYLFFLRVFSWGFRRMFGSECAFWKIDPHVQCPSRRNTNIIRYNYIIVIILDIYIYIYLLYIYICAIRKKNLLVDNNRHTFGNPKMPWGKITWSSTDSAKPINQHQIYRLI